MNNSLSRRVPVFREPGPALQLLASVTLVFVLAFGADVLPQWAVGLFVVGIVEQDTFFYSAVRQYELLLRIVGNQPPFFLLAALVTASMYVFILAYCLFDYAKELRGMYREQAIAERRNMHHGGRSRR